MLTTRSTGSTRTSSGRSATTSSPCPTDCPQRDERLGWTGDAQAFAPTGSTLFDARRSGRPGCATSRSTRTTCWACPSVVPDVVIDGEARFGRAGWADAATIVPWAVYESVRRRRFLRDQLDAHAALGRLARARLGADGLLAAVGMQFGDWLDPDAPVGPAVGGQGRLEYLANAFLAFSARLAADAADAAR